MTQSRAIAEISVASAIWGFGFIATRYMLESVPSLQAMTWRFLLASLLAGIWLMSKRSIERKATLRRIKSYIALAFIPGILIGAALVFQTLGLKQTSVANNSFITCLYIVMVPLIQSIVMKKSISPLVWLCVGTALWGAGAMCGVTWSGGKFGLNRGDVLTFCCAIMCSFHIVWIDRIVDRIEHAFWFNVVQSVWAGLWILPLALYFEGSFAWRPLVENSRALGGLIFLSTASTLLAFMLQIRSQRVLSPALASMLFLLEGPYATLFAFLLLGERVTAPQVMGAVLVLMSCVGVVRLESSQAPSKAQ